MALVGYTNAGKSTLLNRLTGAGVLVEDRLFSTLDATVRRLALPGGETVLLSDTVGFVRKLPHQLVEAFRSTLEEVVDADLLVHVVDASSPEARRQIEAVRTVLRELDAGDVPELLVANKLDVADPDELAALRAAGALPLSAVTGDGIEQFLDVLAERLRALNTVVELSVPYERGDVLAALHREGEVLVEVHDDQATSVRARLPKGGVDRFREFLASSRPVADVQHRPRRGVHPADLPLCPPRRLKQLAGRAEGGIVDLSIGTPNDPVPEVVAAGAGAGRARRRPAIPGRSVGRRCGRRRPGGWSGASASPSTRRRS